MEGNKKMVLGEETERYGCEGEMKINVLEKG